MHAKNVLHVTDITHIKLINHYNIILLEHGRRGAYKDNIINIRNANDDIVRVGYFCVQCEFYEVPLIAILMKVGINLGIPTARGILQPIKSFLAHIHFVLMVDDGESLGLIHVNFLFQVSIQEGKLDIHLVDYKIKIRS